MVHLISAAQRLFASSLAPASLRSYSAAFRNYQLFCLHATLPVFPIVEHTLILFCTHLSHRIAAKTIKSYLSGIRFHVIASAFVLEFTSMPRLYYLLRGIKRTQGNRHTLPPQKPFTTVHLRTLLSWLQKSTCSTTDRRLWWSACTLAFFGLLRASEYTAPTTSTALPSHTLFTGDICFSSGYTSMTVFIKTSKTDPFKVGCSIRIGSTGNVFCPVHALRLYLHTRSTSLASPLFVFSDGTFLTCQRFSTFLSSVLQETNLNTHSFRIGGASALAAAGYSDAFTQITGRWASDCFKKYIRLLPSLLQHYAGSMCSVDIGATCWKPLS